MWTQFLILLWTFIPLNNKSNFFTKNSKLVYDKDCQTQIDSLTHTKVYITADTKPENEGGLNTLLSWYDQVHFDSIPPDFNTEFIIMFIVRADGKIIGERIVKDKTGQVGQQLIEIAKSLRWKPAICNGKKVPMLHKLYMKACLSEN